MTDEMAPRRRASRARAARSFLGAVLIATVISAAVIDRLGPGPGLASASVRPPATGGVWACPVVATGKLGGWVNLVNPSSAASQVRVRWIRPPLRPVVVTQTVPPLRTISLRTPPSKDVMVSAVVAWGGGEIVASRGAFVRTTQSRTVAIGGACSQPGDPTLVAPGLSTLAADSQIVIVNPSAADALVDVSFLVDGDEQVPQSTHARVVPPYGRLVLRAGDYVFDKARFAAVVRTTTGSVVADALVQSGTSGMIVPASAPQTEGAAVASAVKGARLEVVAVGDDPSTVEAATITPRSRGTTAGFPPGLDADAPAFVRFGGAGPFAVSLDDREGSPFSAALMWGVPAVSGGDYASVPVSRATARWVGVIGPPAGRASGFKLVVVNPGSTAITMRIRLLGTAGEVPAGTLASVTLAGGRVSSYSLSGVRGRTVGVEITADGPVGASLLGFGGRGIGSFLYACGGRSSEPAASLAIHVDDRAGVDAP
jgi:Family of unknown function (DUF5719)